MNHRLYLIGTLMILNIPFFSCNTPKSYKPDNQHKISAHQLNEELYNQLIFFLQSHSEQPIKDTVIIKYDYNNTLCWEAQEQRDKEYTLRWINDSNERIQAIREGRPGVSILQFREPGNKTNSFKKWNSQVIVDTSKYLFQLFFNERAICGTSVIVLPNRKYILVKSDAHFDAAYYTSDAIAKLVK